MDAIASLAMSSSFIKSISTYLSHLDPSVRRCGMLVAEEVARASGKALDFGDWDGEVEGKEWCRRMRRLAQHLDNYADEDLVASLEAEAKAAKVEGQIDEIVSPAIAKPSTPPQKHTIETVAGGYDSDDSLTGYASEPSSSRSPSPTPSELDEIEKDPTLRVTQSKVARPVYLAQLGELVRPTGGVKANGDEDEPKKIEVALDVAEELIRRKRDFGTELGKSTLILKSWLLLSLTQFQRRTP